MTSLDSVNYIPLKHQLTDACSDSGCVGIHHRIPLAQPIEDERYLYVPNSLVYKNKSLHSRVTKWYQQDGTHRAQFRPDIADRIQDVHNIILKTLSVHLKREIEPTQISIKLIDQTTTQIRDKKTGKILAGSIPLTADSDFCRDSQARTIHDAMLFLWDEINPHYVNFGSTTPIPEFPHSSEENQNPQNNTEEIEKISESHSSDDNGSVSSAHDESDSSITKKSADVKGAQDILRGKDRESDSSDTNIQFLLPEAFIPPDLSSSMPEIAQTMSPSVQDRKEPIQKEGDWNQEAFLKLLDDPTCQDEDAVKVYQLLKRWYEKAYQEYPERIDYNSYNNFIESQDLSHLEKSKAENLYRQYMSFLQWFLRLPASGKDIRNLGKSILNECCYIRN